MKSKIVNVFYCDDMLDTLQMTLQVSNRKNRIFRFDWNAELEKAKRNNPTNWVVTDVLAGLKKRGWLITKLRTIEVAY